MVLYSPDWTNIGFSFILLTVNLFRHPTHIEHGQYSIVEAIHLLPVLYIYMHIFKVFESECKMLM